MRKLRIIVLTLLSETRPQQCVGNYDFPIAFFDSGNTFKLNHVDYK